MKRSRGSRLRLGMAVAGFIATATFAIISPDGRIPRAWAMLPKADKVLVLKSERQLLLMKDGAAYRVYDVALGPNPEGHKQRQGDGRTPEGLYILDSRNPDSNFYRAIHISYPNESDRESARRMGVPPGGNILIHGLPGGMEDLGPDHALWDWTNGCIAVTNQEMDEIWRAVDNGTPIEIRP